MDEQGTVLMVSGGEETILELRKVLNEAGMHVRMVRSCAEARELMDGLSFPAVLFCETSLPDGTWTDVLTLAAGAPAQVPVVVVSRLVDINLYINALESGAADFIVPPFLAQDVSHVMNCAAQKNMAVEVSGAA